MTISEMRTAKGLLVRRGWQEAATLMRSGTSEEFGTLYFKGTGENKQKFWLNINTYKRLPR